MKQMVIGLLLAFCVMWATACGSEKTAEGQPTQEQLCRNPSETEAAEEIEAASQEATEPPPEQKALKAPVVSPLIKGQKASPDTPVYKNEKPVITNKPTVTESVCQKPAPQATPEAAGAEKPKATQAGTKAPETPANPVAPEKPTEPAATESSAQPAPTEPPTQPQTTEPQEPQTEASSGLLRSFSATDIDGNPVDQSIFSGYKLTMVNIWATFCSPCIGEMPELGKLNADWKEKGVQVVGIVLDTENRDGSLSQTQIKKAKQIIGKTAATYLHILPSADLNKLKLDSVSAVPETFFVDGKGNIVGESYLGAKSKSEWEKIVSALLG